MEHTRNIAVADRVFGGLAFVVTSHEDPMDDSGRRGVQGRTEHHLVRVRGVQNNDIPYFTFDKSAFCLLLYATY